MDKLREKILSPEQKKQIYIDLAAQIIERNEVFPFPGMDPESYTTLKAEYEEFPDYSANTDELIERFKTQGLKVAFSKDSTTGNIFVIPAESSDIEMDSLFPRHLTTLTGMDAMLKKLILLNKELKK